MSKDSIPTNQNLVATPLEEIRQLHEDLLTTTLDKAIRIGELLTEQKASLKHGEWLPWIEENLPFDRATAANYMRLFDRREELKCKTVLHLTDAYKLLAPPPTEPPPTPAKPPQASYYLVSGIDYTFGQKEGCHEDSIQADVN
jgi:hypothetical protein